MNGTYIGSYNLIAMTVIVCLLFSSIVILVFKIRKYKKYKKEYKVKYEKLEIENKELKAQDKELRIECTELLEKEEKMNRMVYYDSLTKLPNRLYLAEKLKEILEGFSKDKKQGAVFFIDLDNFKNTNDTLGHDYGDQLLIIISETFKIIIPEDTFLFRWGGDEFVIILQDVNSDEEIIEIANGIINYLQKPFEVGERHVYVTPSIGIARYPADGIDVNAIIKNADIAMYKSKNTGKNRYQFYDEVLHKEIYRKNDIGKKLRNALQNNEMFVLYQPQINAISGKIESFEALLRWRNDKFGMISPVEFIPIAEETRLILSIGEWVLNTACKNNKELIDKGYETTVAVNVSSLQLKQSNFVDIVKNALERSGLAPQFLEIEITESIFMGVSENEIIRVLKELRELKIQIALDDFGTGYSSLSYLKRLPINNLKIDKRFIDDVPHDPQGVDIVAGIIQLAHVINLKVTAEGVEKSEQIEILKGMNCDLFQGYHYSKPISFEALHELLDK